MKNITELMQKAHELKEKGFTTGEIADELNISRETALWLVTRETEAEKKVPRDIYIDWSVAGSNPAILKHLSLALSDLIKAMIKENNLPQPEVIAGIAESGIPIATIIAEDMNASLSVIRPIKHMWGPDKKSKQAGFILSNFSQVKGKNVVIVDDIATTGTTIKDTIKLLDEKGANPLAAVVLIDKKGIKSIEGKPVKALVSVGIVEDLK
ncbi:MAG: orotate phosphoribosyltransferase-like protein [Methanobacteriota archaeon]